MQPNSLNKVLLTWEGDMRFRATPPSGQEILFDAAPEHGGHQSSFSPVEALLASAAACSAMDVASILQKKRQKVHQYSIEVTWTRGPEGEYPRPITSMHLRHMVEGEAIDPEAVRHAVQLSDEKYCTVIATLRANVSVTSDFRIS